MVEDDHGYLRSFFCGAAPGVFNPGSLPKLRTTTATTTISSAGRRIPCFAHVADVINNTVATPSSGSTHQGLETKLNPSPLGDPEAADMKGGSLEFRGKDLKRIKLELKSKHAPAGSFSCIESEFRVNETGDGSGMISVDKMHARINLESNTRSRDSSTGLRRVGTDRFGLWSEFEPGDRAGKVCFKWLPLEPEVVSKPKLRSNGEFSLKNVHLSKFSSSSSSSSVKGMKPGNKPNATGEPGKNYNEEIKNFICGGFAGVVSRTAVAPLDLIKTHLITSHGMHGYHKTATEIFFEIWKADGWRGLFRGNGVNCLRVAPCKAIELCTFEIVKKIMNKKGNPLRGLAAPIAGGAAGMAGTLATYPLELIRTRISLQPQKYSGAVSAILKIIHEEGFMALYSGLTPSVLGVFPYAATNYFVYDGLRTAYRKAAGTKHVPTGLTLLFGAVAAAASSAVTYPLEVARRQMQMGSAALVVRNSTLDVVKHIYAEEGFLALYRGLGTTWLKLVPAAGISFVCYEAARRAWELEEQQMIQRRKK